MDKRIFSVPGNFNQMTGFTTLSSYTLQLDYQ